MRTRIQKWGNSLALRIPSAFAKEVRLEQDSLVEVSLKGRSLLVKPVREEGYRLDQLLEGVTEDNIHQEVDAGGPVGREAW